MPEKDLLPLFATAALTQIERTRLLRRTCDELRKITDTEVLFTHGSHSAELEEIIEGDESNIACGMIRFGENSFDVFAMSKELEPMATLAMVTLTDTDAKPFTGWELEELDAALNHCVSTVLSAEREQEMGFDVLGLKTSVAFTSDPEINAHLLLWAFTHIEQGLLALESHSAGNDDE